MLTITHLLRQHGVVGKFVEFFGPGVAAVPLANRATIGNMSPEYGATCAIFPIDEVTLDYLRFTGRDDDHVALVEAYAKEQGLFHRADGTEPVFSETIELDLSTVVPSIAGPARPQDLVALAGAGAAVPDRPRAVTQRSAAATLSATESSRRPSRTAHVVIAAITSCTNTSNPQVMVAAGLLAKRAVDRGLRPKPWVKTSSPPAPGWSWTTSTGPGSPSRWPQLGFDLVGFGCTTCIGNSGPLLPGVSEAVHDGDLSVAVGAVGQPQLRGPHPPRRADELPGLAAPGGGLRPGRHHGHRPHHRPARHRRRRPAGAPGRPLADRATR